MSLLTETSPTYRLKSVTSQKILQNMRNIHSNGEVMHHD
ncbi:hypothetical protein VCHA47P369_30568 [Vibrio chagasii]|nr:hypothetical protein VCHA36O163_150015 [Vibrio chagasii]CAH6825523.1 hypothetical protein VCHA34P121_160076 [Vibrio chagasii]CAH6851986.1 hypothetical protein VCHA34P129_200016 [Vibrio chagasii]CAH6860433.1 hypothetical protein VCHA34P131_240010 [Vibrio chagasii]CAH6881196.1 hypothetical protein VCHA36P164_20016 [Vibrio chagasii]